jgi:hypothetical protein
MKNLTWSALALSSALLSACGGGDSNTNGNNNSPDTTQGIQLQNYAQLEMISDLQLVGDVATVNKVAYQKIAFNWINGNQLAEAETLLYKTAGLNLGTEPNVIRRIITPSLNYTVTDDSPATWVGSTDQSFSLREGNGMQTNVRVQPHALDTHTLASELLPRQLGIQNYQYLEPKLAQLQQSTQKFSSGSQCLQMKGISYSEDHLEFYPDYDSTTMSLAQWKASVSRGQTGSFVSGNFNSVSYTYFKPSKPSHNIVLMDPAWDAYLIYQGSNYLAEFTPKEGFDFGQAQVQIQQQLADPTLSTLERSNLQQMQTFLNEPHCTWYNPQATASIEAALK